MIPVVRDEMWNSCLKQACSLYKKVETDPECQKFADASWRLKKRYQECYTKRSDRSVKLISKK